MLGSLSVQKTTYYCLFAAVPSMGENSIHPDFSFAGRVRNMSPQELQVVIEQGSWGMDDQSPIIRGLQRGIGVHHSGLPTKYRQVVEILFRCRYLRVVIATGTKLVPQILIICMSG